MAEKEFLKSICFPYDETRKIQSEMVSDVHLAIESKKNIIMHAPTGIGKTAAALAPALAIASKKGLTIFYLTSRQTQHKIVIDTLKIVKKKYGNQINCADIIGKKWMCLQNAVEAMSSNSFHEYCRQLRSEGTCEFYTKTRKISGSPTSESEISLEKIGKIGPCHVHELISESKKCGLCPYEIASMVGMKSNVIVADYYYIFNAAIRNGFLKKIGKDLGNIILIIDEAHNLPTRIRDLMTQRTSSAIIEYAKKEARKYGMEEQAANLEIVGNSLGSIGNEVTEQEVISRSRFYDAINSIKPFDLVLTGLVFAGNEIMRAQKKSFTNSVAKFLEAWIGPDLGYGRFITRERGKKNQFQIDYRCLDPSLAAKEVIDQCYSTVMMSGTLTPTDMYTDILGFGKGTIEKEYKSPFPKKNRLNLIIPKTTTKYNERNTRQFDEIASICAKIANSSKGNSAMFFPSYDLLQNISVPFMDYYKMPLFLEKSRMTKEEKETMINAFKKHKDTGAALFGVSTGSFGEGIDMPGVLKSVVVVGLPLQKPDAEAKLLIEYYEDKFGRGMEYGYVLPAITKCLQNAGRCIRSETDKGAVIFLDERYAMRNYLDCFPEDWDMEIELDYIGTLETFFGR